jgi:hypothetical protein
VGLSGVTRPQAGVSAKSRPGEWHSQRCSVNGEVVRELKQLLEVRVRLGRLSVVWGQGFVRPFGHLVRRSQNFVNRGSGVTQPGRIRVETRIIGDTVLIGQFLDEPHKPSRYTAYAP